MANDLAQALVRVSGGLGVNPLDLGTVMSYETGGTFDPWKRGPTTQWGQHRGLIQWGEPQAARYGVNANTPVAQQVDAVGQYLKDAGVRPGMGLMDLYSAVNAGHVGRNNASDAGNGGAPGTVADKVATMAPHEAKAAALLNGLISPPSGSPGAPVAPAGAPAQAGPSLLDMFTRASQGAQRAQSAPPVPYDDPFGQGSSQVVIAPVRPPLQPGVDPLANLGDILGQQRQKLAQQAAQNVVVS